jgi:PhnB protein
MTSRLNPYISFDNNAREALEFYQSVFGGTLTIHTFGDFGQADTPLANNVMHGMLETDNGYTIMAADTMPQMNRSVGNNITVSVSGDDLDQLTAYWVSLSDGGSIQVEFDKQMWGDIFGMCTDKFGIDWMVNVVATES